MTFQNLEKEMLIAIKTNHVPMLVGEPAIGKSSFIEDFAQTFMNPPTKCFTFAANQVADKADVTGVRTGEYNGDFVQKFFPHIKIKMAVEYAKAHPDETPILFIDEINRTSPDVTSELLSIPTMREIGDTKLPDNLRIVIAGNDNGNVTALDSASITRFVLFHVEPDVPTFFRVNPNLNNHIKNVLQKNPDYIFVKASLSGMNALAATNANNQNSNDDDDDEDQIAFTLDDSEQMIQFTAPRTIKALSDYLNEHNQTELIQKLNTPDGEQSLLQSVLEGYTGCTIFTMSVLEDIMNTQFTPASTNTNLMPPQKYLMMCNATTRDEIANIISSMTDEEKSESILYACYDRRDNSAIIPVLAQMTTRLMPKEISTFANLAQTNQIDRRNLEILQQTNGAIKMIIDALGL